MLSRSTTKGRIRADSTPSQNRSAIDNQITRTDEPMTQGVSTLSTKRASGSGAPVRCSRFHCWEGLGMRGRPSLPSGKPKARDKIGHEHNQSRISL